MENSLKFLKEKGLIKEGNTRFFISGDFETVELCDLLDEYSFRLSFTHEVI